MDEAVGAGEWRPGNVEVVKHGWFVEGGEVRDRIARDGVRCESQMAA